MDIGRNTEIVYKEAIKRAKTIVWNGPMGVFEWEAFRHGS